MSLPLAPRTADASGDPAVPGGPAPAPGAAAVQTSTERSVLLARQPSTFGMQALLDTPPPEKPVAEGSGGGC